MEKKYIVELPENTHWIQWIMEGTKDHHPYMDFKQVEDLIPYTEPDFEQIREDAFKNGYDAACKDIDIKSKINAAYRKGMEDAWDAARTLWNTPNRKEIFGHTTFNTVLTTLTAQKTIEKIRQYEQRQEEQIQVGDEVINRDKKAVVTEITDRFVRIMYSNGSGYALFSENMTKTGRHFPEIATVLKKMRGGQDG